MVLLDTTNKIDQLNDKAIEERRDDAVRRALNTPPKHQRHYVKAKPKKKVKASASRKKGA